MKPTKLSDDEIKQMFNLIKRHTTYEMDQWDLFKFDDEYGKVYIEFSLQPRSGAEESYTDINHLLKEEK